MENEKNTKEKKPVSGSYVIGRNAVAELLKSGRDTDKIFITKNGRGTSLSVIAAEAMKRGIPVIETESRKLDEMSGGANHQGVVAVAALISYSSVDDMIALAESKGEKPILVIADSIDDPQNLGALIRSAEIFGVHGIIIPKRRAVGLTEAVGRASAGAIEHMLIAKVANLAATVDELKEKGFWIYAAEAGGTDFAQADYSSPTALIMGSEGSGVARLLKDKSDFIVSIPMYGSVNSLNVSAAAAVILCEIAKQRHRT